MPDHNAEPAPPVRRLAVSELLRGAREIEIEHAGRIYRLRLTSQGKLILTA
jgi:hemin uptake protein HemP